MPSKWAQKKARDIMDAACLSERYVRQDTFAAALHRNIAAALDEAIAEALEVVRFYADKGKYAVRMMSIATFEPEIMDDHGTQARAFLAKHGGTKGAGAAEVIRCVHCGQPATGASGGRTDD